MIMLRSRKSFTLVEILIVVFLVGIAGMLVMQTFQAGTSFLRTESTGLIVQQSARAIMRRFSSDLRMATTVVGAATLANNGDALAIETRGGTVIWQVSPHGTGGLCLTRDGSIVGGYLLSLQVVPGAGSADVLLSVRARSLSGRVVNYTLCRKVRWRNV